VKRWFVSSGRFAAVLFGLTEGLLVASLVVNIRDAMVEDAFFRDIATRAVADAQSPEEQLLAIVHKTHVMLAPLREAIAQGAIEDVSGLAHYRRVLFHTVGQDSLFPSGECGSFAGVLVRLLKTHGVPVRFGQMLDSEKVTGVAHHIVVEAWLDGRWVICDPMYDLVFRGDDGRILGYDEIRRDWERLKAQCPPGYDMKYDYRGFRRVNFGPLNTWLQQTPLAGWSIRTWLIEGAWIRVSVVALLLTAVVVTHGWYERMKFLTRASTAAG